ncbi:MAG TPA: TerC/Alx family metal homeostasis membrane protein [Propionibacteriaceae bacterium]|nr:TerC/Alx family metal homeostasis membrane protein [Propionibacteriaceae bacterium]
MLVTPLAWTLTIVVLLVVLAFDVFVVGRRPHEPSMRESAIAIGVYVGAAILFGVGVSFFMHPQYGGQFFAGWLTEYSLSVDNLFIFLIIMSKMSVPRHLQQYALLVGIILALAFRGVFIALGAGLIHLFSGIFFVFGAFLIYTAIHLAKEYFEHDTEEEAVDNFATRWVKRRFRFTPEFHGTKLRVDGEEGRSWTPLFLVVVALGTADLLFALDSIPAIYGLTSEPYLVLTANIFALMGLRQLYFLLGNLLRRLVYLSLGLSVILAFIGVKLVLHAMHEYHLDARLGFDGEVSLGISLTVIVGTLVITTVASIIASRRVAGAERVTSGD